MHAVARRTPKRKRSEEIRSLSDIAAGDLVVHAAHGIGKFLGVRQIEMDGVTKTTSASSTPERICSMCGHAAGCHLQIHRPAEDVHVKLNRLSSAGVAADTE